MTALNIATIPRFSQTRKKLRSDDAAGLGAYLRERRTGLGRSVEDVAAALKVTPARLTALENGAFDRLPSGIYRRGIVRAYAAMLGLDAAEVVAEFRRLCPEEEPPLPTPEQIKPPAARRESPPWIGSIAAGILLAAGFAALSALSDEPAAAPPALIETEWAAESSPRDVVATTGDEAADIELASVDMTPPTPPADPAESLLHVTSTPSGARVAVNGIGWGSTPVTIRYLPRGEKTVRVTMDGFESAETTVMLAETGSASVNLNLRAMALQ